MRNLKKVLVLVLCLAMMASIMVTGAAAAFTDQKDIDSKHQEAIDMAIALKMVEGYPDGSFQPNGNVTRAEMAKIICIALNGGKVPATSVKPTPTFADIDGHWAEGFIEYCYAKGVVAGKNDTTFDPSGNVTGSEAAKMLLVALGYNADVEKYVGSDWELYVNVQANQDGLYDKLLDIETAEPLSREHAAQMIWNAIQAYIVNKTSEISREDGTIRDNYVKSTWQDMLNKYYDGEIRKGTLDRFTYKGSPDKEWTYEVDGERFTSTVDYTALLGQQVKVVYNQDKEVYGMFADKSQVLFSGVIGDLPTMANDASDFKFDGTKYKFDVNNISALPVYFFQYFNYYYEGSKMLSAVAGKDETNNNANITDYDALPFSAVDKDGDGNIDFLMVVPYAVAKVTYVNNTDIRTGNPVYDPVGTNPGTKFSKDDVTFPEGLAKDDYVAIIDEDNTANQTAIFTKLDLVSGKVSVKDGVKLTIDGTVYKMDKAWVETVKAGNTVKDVPVYNGYAFAGSASGNYAATDFVVLMNKHHDDDGFRNDQARLMFSDGTKKYVDLDEGAYNTNGVIPINNLVKGQLYVYETNSDGEYQLKAAPVNTDSFKTGYDYTNATNPNVTYSSNKAAYIDGYKIADDAVVFVKYDNDSSYKVITGATLKTMNEANNHFVGNYVVANDNSSTGVGAVNIAYVTSSAGTVNSNTDYYAYVVKVVETTNANNEDIYAVTLMTKDGNDVSLNTIKITSTNTSATGDLYGLAEGNAIAYNLDSDGNLCKITDFDAPLTGKDLSTAITGIDSDALWLDGGKTPYDLDKNVIFLTVDASEGDAVAVGDINSIAVAEEPTKGNYEPNALIILDDDGEIALVVYDVDNGL